MTKKGTLYIGHHSDVQKDKNAPFYTHGSFLDDIPAEMSGLMTIRNGKVVRVSPNTGHYASEELDTYRFIKRLEKDMPGVLADDAVVLDKYDDNPTKVRDFMEKMEKPGIDGKPLHETLRENRVKEIEEYEYLINNARSISITNTNQEPIQDLITDLDARKKQELASVLQMPGGSILVKDERDKVIADYDVPKLAKEVIDSGSVLAIQVLLDANISERKDFQELDPLSRIIKKDPINMSMVDAILDDPNAAKLLEHESELQKKHGGDNLLHVLAEPSQSKKQNDKRIKIINRLLGLPTVRSEMLYQKNWDDKTPLQVAEDNGNTEVSEIFKRAIRLEGILKKAKEKSTDHDRITRPTSHHTPDKNNKQQRGF